MALPQGAYLYRGPFGYWHLIKGAGDSHGDCYAQDLRQSIKALRLAGYHGTVSVKTGGVQRPRWMVRTIA